MVMLNCLVASGGIVLLAFTVKLAVPGEVGVPLIIPVEDSCSPAGRLPEARLQTMGVSPEADNV